MGNIRATIQGEKNGESEINLLSMQDYYPFGSPMPGRSIANTAAYKQGYQGQQVDGETSFNAFELRLYDSRLGSWLTPDPYRQHLSPYMAMSNNPFGAVDPDGGWDEEHGNGEGFNGDQHSTFAYIDEFYDRCPTCTADQIGMLIDRQRVNGFVTPEAVNNANLELVKKREAWVGSGDYERLTHTDYFYRSVNNYKININIYADRDPYEGVLGAIEYFLTNGHENGIKYNYDGKAIGLAPRGGFAPDVGFAKAASKTYSVYKAIAKNGDTYWGMTKNFKNRVIQHSDRFTSIDEIYSGLSKSAARGLEQLKIDAAGGLKYLDNKINSISINNPKLMEYYKEAIRYLNNL
ncbi:RHS repeat-associated core domain-containing protein [Acidiluteibacter ferrifornacis]|uniref:RHS repeat-associated core domain-containing protein n=1 Tax=Acidiluteibacter ferrifornacis TaxID=2692424 RepID=A0A6N9NDT1_9FLAO|nr:RHS repeat-associated core domain-containing protein [Acidiluteibacter ferrifornacis]NBG64766.1 hypothetical protein [Acidiluteibacter ferrifornacis]